jgi:predicted HD superfamily hydrolase involved in NAD metabolism
LIDYFAQLNPGGDPTVDMQQFYRAVDRLDTLAHVTQVATEALDLAARVGADRAAANLAALAHDLAAVVPAAETIAVAEGKGLRVDRADRAIPLLLHGPIAAAALAEKLDLCDRDLLNAVRYHSTLRAGASVLEKIIFLADKIAYDPTSLHGREYVPVLRAACSLDDATRSLDDAALVYLDFLLDNGWRYGWVLYPNAVAAYRDLTGWTAR